MARGPNLGADRSAASVPLSRMPVSAAAIRELLPAAWGYGLPFVLVVYLGLKGGGYDTVVRSEVGIAAWWLVLCGAAVGALPVTRVTRLGWIGLGLVFAFAAWTALGISWSESSERSMAELGRVLAYLGVFALVLLSQGREGLRRTVCGLGAGIAFVSGLALLSRLQPEWFPANEVAAAFPSTRARLSYPLDYWNGVAAFGALGIPLLLGIACSARSIVGRAVAAAALPLLSLTVFYTLSRGGALEVGAGLLAFIALYPHRLAALPIIGVAGAASALLIAAATQRSALEDGLAGAAAGAQGDEMLAMSVVACAAVGLVVAAIGLVARYEVGPSIRLSRRSGAIGGALAVFAAVLVALALNVPGEISDRWQEFKQPGGAGTSVERFESASGNGRYQLWSSALDANATDPLVGIGPGTYEFWWASEGTLPAFVRDAHSLYLETLAELGVIGLMLIGGLVVFVIVVGARRALGEGSLERRGQLAAATAAAVAFAVAAGVDWAWEVAVLPVCFLILAAAILAPSAESRDRSASRFEGGLTLGARVGIAVAGVAAIVIVAIPLAGTASVRDSQSDVRSARIDGALEKARTARDIQPYAATPGLQEALVLEIAGDLEGAALAAEAATEAEPTNWRTWLVRSRIEAENGDAAASLEAYREAKSLNPNSILFQE